CRAPEYFFIAKDIEVQQVYEQGLSLNELFIVNSSGIKTHRDDFVIDFNADDLTSRIQKFYDLDYSDAEIKTKFELKDNRDWNLSEARQAGIFETTAIKDVLYRPFDYRKIYYDSNLIDFCREKVMKNFHNGKNLGLVLKRSRLLGGTFHYRHTAICNSLCDINFLADQSFVFPLYLYPETTHQQSTEETNHRTPNLNQKLVKQIAENLGLTFTDEKETTANTFAPIDILDYIYAVLHSPNYRETYKEFLKSDFPRVPYPDINTFWQLVKLGGELRQLHLLEKSTNQGLNSSQHSLARSSNLGLYPSYPIDGDNIITRKLNKNDFEITDIENQRGRVWINNSQYFDNVPQTAWEFYIGGYQPAQKWLKDRHGRVLTIEDIKHYQKIINALIETARIMREIDLLTDGQVK
ncbi:MAG: type ISP restriction/modification enzyme, partial [Methylococcales bacterium]|nr:type ISP restriction/modification enzyme [Methylococcales bacterium]